MSVAVGTERRRGRATRGATTAEAEKRPSDSWSRRLPLLPALIFTIVLTQLPFVATLVISFMDWNAYYPNERASSGSPTSAACSPT